MLFGILIFGQPAVEAFTRGGALGPVNIAYSGVYQCSLFHFLSKNQKKKKWSFHRESLISLRKKKKRIWLLLYQKWKLGFLVTIIIVITMEIPKTVSFLQAVSLTVD
jgi:hypothetical protein